MANVKLKLPSLIARTTRNLREHEINASTVREALESLDKLSQGELSKIIFDERNELKRTINIYVNGRNIRFIKKLETDLNDGDEITVLPAVSGG